MRFVITHNNYDPAGGADGVLPPLGGKVQESNQTKQINRFCRCFVL